MKEIWKDIEGYNGVYQVSNMGRVRSFKRCNPKILKARPNDKGYVYVVLCANNYKKQFSVHRLVANVFCDGYKEGLQVDHINGTKTDNRAINLRWLTIRQNNEAYSLNRSVYGVGVIKNRSGRFESRIYFNGKTKRIGTYDTPEQARQARTDFKTKHNLK